jgi:hypothetical protein
MFLLGLFALSDFNFGAHFMIEHWISNLMIPAYLFIAYSLFLYKFESSKGNYWGSIFTYLSFAIIGWQVQM